MLIISPTSIILELLINAAGNNKACRGESGGNKTYLSNLSAFRKFTRTGYLTFKGTKKGGGNPNSRGSNTKNCVKAAKGSNYLTLGTKKAFNLLWHTFTQASIF